MTTITTLYSGSSGNCTLVQTEKQNILVDMGRSCRYTLNALYALGLSAASIDALLITHEHTDHVAGIATFLKHYDVPVYAASACLNHLDGAGMLPGGVRAESLVKGREFALGDIGVTPFGTDHDSLDCLGYRFDFGNKTAAVATDLGRVTDKVYGYLEGCSLVALESNYDDGRLKLGPYPFYLKQRILSDYGHLSNFDCADVLTKLALAGTSRFMLMHLSKENNAPELAYTTCCGIMENHGAEFEQLIVAPRDCASAAVAV